MAGRRQEVKLRDDLEQVVTLRGLGQTIPQIADTLNYSQRAIERAIELTVTQNALGASGGSAPPPEVTAASVAAKMLLKANMILDQISPKAIQSALGEGKIKDVAGSAALLSENSKKTGGGPVKHARAGDIDTLVHRLTEGVGKLALRNKRVEALRKIDRGE